MKYSLVIMSPNGAKSLPYEAANDDRAILMAMYVTAVAGITFPCEVWTVDEATGVETKSIANNYGADLQ